MRVLYASYIENLAKVAPYVDRKKDHACITTPFLYRIGSTVWLGATNKTILVMRRLLSEAEPLPDDEYQYLGSVENPQTIEGSGGWLYLEWDDGVVRLNGRELVRDGFPHRGMVGILKKARENRELGRRTQLWLPKELDSWVKVWAKLRKGCTLRIEHLADENRTIIGNIPETGKDVGEVNAQFLAGRWGHYANALEFWSDAFPLFVDGGMFRCDTEPSTQLVSLWEHNLIVATTDTLALKRAPIQSTAA